MADTMCVFDRDTVHRYRDRAAAGQYANEFARLSNSWRPRLPTDGSLGLAAKGGWARRQDLNL